MKRPSNKLVGGLLALALVGVVVSLYVLRPKPPQPGRVLFTRQAYDRIRIGMTEAEVEEILGAPEGDYTVATKQWLEQLEDEQPQGVELLFYQRALDDAMEALRATVAMPPAPDAMPPAPDALSALDHPDGEDYLDIPAAGGPRSAKAPGTGMAGQDEGELIYATVRIEPPAQAVGKRRLARVVRKSLPPQAVLGDPPRQTSYRAGRWNSDAGRVWVHFERGRVAGKAYSRPVAPPTRLKVLIDKLRAWLPW
jgi:hypothetical protein